MRHPLITKVKDNILRHELLNPYDERPVVVGVSGGADSVALLHTLQKLGYSVIAAHCNYGLRDAESDGDEAYVRDLCSHKDIALEVLKADVAARMSHDGSSMEMACRDIRYEWFETLRCRYDAQAVAVAHHMDDKAETVMLNLLRGTGIRGLASMKWRREPGIIRPLLNLSRDEIKDFLTEEGIGWREDSSNAINDVKRNKLRNIILPRLYEEFTDAKANICATSQHIDEYSGVISDVCSKKREEYVAADGSVDLLKLADAEPYAPLLLWEWFGPQGMTRDMADKIMAFRGNSGSRYGSWHIDHGILQVMTPCDCSDAGHIIATDNLDEMPFEMEIITDRHHFHPQRDASVAYFDADILAGNPRWTLRGWREGDRVRPFGLKGTKLVSDIFANKKMGRGDKQSARILLRDDTIIWIPGIVTCAEYVVTPTTARILRLTVK